MPLLRPVLLALAGLALLASTFGALVVRGVFALRHDYVAEHLCESPDSDCDGKCFLKKRMEAMDGHHGHGEREAPAVMPTAPTLLAVAAPHATVPPDRWRTVPALASGVRTGGASGATGEVFRPPRTG